MSQPQDDKDPSMEDILSSIRKIISDEEGQDTPATEAANDVAPELAEIIEDDEPLTLDEPADEPMVLDVEADKPLVLEENIPRRAEDDPVVLDEIAADAVDPDAQLAGEVADFANSHENDMELDDPGQGDPLRWPAQPETMEDGDLAMTDEFDGTAAPQGAGAPTAAAAFGRLQDTVSSNVSGDSRTVETIVRDLLKPMMQEWLDANLQTIVEQMVQEEIERITRYRK